jgi:hypothetical protein
MSRLDRLTNNELGFLARARRSRKLERILMLLPDSPATYPERKRLVIKHSVQGIKVHDTRLVAAMNVHGVGRILSFNALPEGERAGKFAGHSLRAGLASSVERRTLRAKAARPRLGRNDPPLSTSARLFPRQSHQGGRAMIDGLHILRQGGTDADPPTAPLALSYRLAADFGHDPLRAREGEVRALRPTAWSSGGPPR